MFRLYSHLQVCHIYKTSKIILKLNGSVNLNELQFKSFMHKNYTLNSVNQIQDLNCSSFRYKINGSVKFQYNFSIFIYMTHLKMVV
jgi:hypothetical protein